MIKAPSKPENYCVVSNEVARREDLSARSKGIYYYLATLPENWKLSQTELIKHFTEGREAIKNAFKELVKSGYITKSVAQDKKGLLQGVEYKVHWSIKPVNQKTVRRSTSERENRKTVNQPLLSTKEVIKEEVSINEVNTKEILKADKSAENELLKSKFEIFWKNYGKSKEKKVTFEKFKKLSPEIIELAIFKAKEQADKIEMRFRKDPKRWIAGECWNDVIISDSKPQETYVQKVNRELEESFPESEQANEVIL